VEQDGKLLLRHGPFGSKAHARLHPPLVKNCASVPPKVEPGLFARMMERPARSGIATQFSASCATSRTASHSARAGEVFLFGLPLAVLLAVVGGWLVARRSLSPVASMAGRAGDLHNSLSQRLPVTIPMNWANWPRF
jgi:hypothetical protein